MKPCRVLVIEDNEEVAQLLGRAFGAEGYTVDVVGHAGDARRAIELDGYDLTVIDITLPGGEDGFSLARRAQASGLGVILISGNHDLSDRLASAPHPYLLKPFRMSELLRMAVDEMQRAEVQCGRAQAD